MSIMSVVSSVASAVSSKAESNSAAVHLHGHIPAAWYHYSLRTITLILLPLLSIIGAFGTMVLGAHNGTFDHISTLAAQDSPIFPGSNVLLLKEYTGVGAIDTQLAVLVTFFAPVVDSRNSALYLFAIFGLGQFGAAWTLLVMESLRSGNKGRLVSFIGTTGLILQNISYAITVPLYLFLHIMTSPVAKPFPGTHANSVLLISPMDLKILPLSIVLAYIVPSILMGLESSRISGSTHQKLIAFWQPFPLWTVMIHWFVRSCCRFFSNEFARGDAITQRPAAPLGESYLSNAKHVYRFVLTLCMGTHIPILLIGLLPPWTISGILPKVAVYAQYNLVDIFIPYFPLLDHRVPDLAAGALNFLQWDLATGSTALLIWAVFLYRNATTEKAIVDPTHSLPKYHKLLTGELTKASMLRRKLIFKIILWTIMAGPIGALTVLLWERDEIVRQKIKQGV
ncbi:hypothetical protein ACMFMG_011023 [Clarireedia jacksonii]